MSINHFSVMLICILIADQSLAQSALSGRVYVNGDSILLSNVLVRDLSNKHLAITGKDGSFKIPAKINDLLVFTLNDYIPDTLFVVDLTAKKIELSSSILSLNEVKISASPSAAAFDPRKDYPEVYEKSKFALSPTRLFGKDARNARHLQRYFDNEIKQRKIDSIFNRKLVSGIIPLQGKDLRNFMILYRPRLSFLNKSSPDELNLYISACYKRFVALTPEEQALPKLY